jgi:ribonucleoside-diphosphate reductase alpha chain
MDALSVSVSHGLQYGVPLKAFVKAMMSTSYAPSGITDDPEVRTASSITDYIARRLALDYLSFDDRLELGLASIDDMPEDQISLLTDDQSADGQLVEESERLVSRDESADPEPAPEAPSLAVAAAPKTVVAPKQDSSAAPMCYHCGNQTQRAGSCYVCTSCGSTTGCS